MNIKNFFSFPLRILKITIRLLKVEFNEYKTNSKLRYEKLIKTYKLCGFKENRNNYIDILNESLRILKYPKYNESEGMYSEHLVIFAAISKSNIEINNILEIGTFDGKTSTILAKLFPNSKITTIDLQDKDPIFINTYDRKSNFAEFIKNRNFLISKNKNINFIQMNSLQLSITKNNLPKQDLIWVDGAHGYPVVASDITNAIGLMNNQSILMCDDIWKKQKSKDNYYDSIAGYETLNSFSQANIIETYFFSKRVGKKYNDRCKYVSFSKLKNNQK